MVRACVCVCEGVFDLEMDCRAGRRECRTAKGKEDTWDAGRGPKSGASAGDGRVCDGAGGDG